MHQINAKQRAPNLILRGFAAIQTSQHTYLQEKTEQINVNGYFKKKDYRGKTF